VGFGVSSAERLRRELRRTVCDRDRQSFFFQGLFLISTSTSTLTSMRKTFLRLGSFLALLAVAIGAFGAHKLASVLPADRLEVFHTGVRYHFYHSFGVLIVAVLLHFRKTSLILAAGWLFFTGIVLFSGSLYLLAFKDMLILPMNVLGPLTPIGGVLFITGWGCLFFSTYQRNRL
jgi:uncharacterized membrane protein YgdD (TMEM256/DUF423 family)